MNKLITIIFLIFSIFSFAHAKDAIPQFSEYPVNVYTGKTAKLDISDPDARMFRTRLSEALKEPVDFAGEYVIATWGCGAMCRSYSFINKKTGKLLQDGFGGEEQQEDVVGAKPNSRLIITNEEVRNSDYEVKSIAIRFYILEKGKFKLLKTLKKPVTN